jgi:hypothetical protein
MNGGERGIRTITGVDSAVSCTLRVAIMPALATFAKAPWPKLAHEPEAYGKRHGEPEKVSERRALVLIYDGMRKTLESKKRLA